VNKFHLDSHKIAPDGRATDFFFRKKIGISSVKSPKSSRKSIKKKIKLLKQYLLTSFIGSKKVISFLFFAQTILQKKSDINFINRLSLASRNDQPEL
jgi:hypothetical protein